MITTSSGVKIMTMGKNFYDILDYQPSPQEEGWSDEQIDKQIRQFKYGRVLIEEEDSDPEEPKTQKPVKATSAPKTIKPKFDATGYVTANDIATQLKVEGREVRGVLRSLKLEKPDHGWSWSPTEAEAIKKQIKEGLKK
jgi:predicted glycosyltransferase